MIHSMSGGVLSEDKIYTFAKVVCETPFWYLVPEEMEFLVKPGSRVRVPVGGALAEGTVVKLERADKKTAPLPLNRIRPVAEVLQ